MLSEKASLTRISVLILLIAVLTIFYFMVQGFLMALVLSAIFSGIMYGLYERLTRRFNGRKSLASLATILIFVLAVVIPLGVFSYVLVKQTIHLSENFLPVVKERIEHPDSFADELEEFGVVKGIFPQHEQVLEIVNKGIQAMTGFVTKGLENFTTGTAKFFFEAFIALFAMYYFLIHGKEYINQLLYYLPLKTVQERILLDRFVTVTKSTLKGALIIGIVQGGLGAIAMALAGVDSVLFWGVVMAVLSIIPGVGPAIIWLPAGIFLFFGGHVPQAIGLILFGVIVIGNIDNFMRPRLMAKDTKLPDLMILCGTLGGLALFGVSGLVIGPIVAALVISMLEIYAETFKDQLQPVELLDEDDDFQETE